MDTTVEPTSSITNVLYAKYTVLRVRTLQSVLYELRRADRKQASRGEPGSSPTTGRPIHPTDLTVSLKPLLKPQEFRKSPMATICPIKIDTLSFKDQYTNISCYSLLNFSQEHV
uniref:Uncharacterized protein n=1 Tax=Vespula pensylvanica TaxID=30213 RepID=A0A834NZT3_VESPE|nr:hypothetical protein H0235_009956 [Vespula pensylvanica]